MSDKPRNEPATLAPIDRCMLVTIIILLLIVVVNGAWLVDRQNALSDRCAAGVCGSSTQRLVDTMLAQRANV